ncbi:MAG: CcmD family protein [Actinomycetota bacterium]|nr:CcmD family protein [Actinomycetota bacterium]
MGIKDIPLQTAVSYVAGAYIGIWVILFGYLLAMGSKLSNLRRQVDALTEAVERKDKNENLV